MLRSRVVVNLVKQLIRVEISSVRSKYTHSYVSSTSTTPLLHETIGERLLKTAHTFGDKEAFVFPFHKQRMTFDELKQKAENLAAGLMSMGLKRGDRLGVWATNCPEWIVAQYATALAGIIQVNINPAYKTSELEYSLRKVGCKALIMSQSFKTQNYVQMLGEICPEIESSSTGVIESKRLPEFKRAIIIGERKPNNGYSTFEEILSLGKAATESRKELEKVTKTLQFSDPINIQYTSGTTGNPKGVVLSHHMILNNAYQLAIAQQYHLSDTKICLPLPLYHCFGMVLGSLATVVHGLTCVLPSPTFHAEDALRAIQDEKCTTVYGTPTMYIDMYNHANLSKYNVSSLNAGVMSGSTCPIETVKEAVEKLHTKNIVVVYGMTETSPLITLNYKNDTLENRTQTIGQVLEHLEVKLVDAENRIVPVNQPGELLVRGYNTMVEYWGDQDKTNEVYTPDRFLRTGDIVRMNEQGYFVHESRLKDVVIRGGENIYPREVEEFLHWHPKIADVYVVGVPDKRMGEEICACVRLRRGHTMTDTELKEYCKNKIAHFKIPKYVEFMDEFPMTVTGKIQKNKLRDAITEKLKLK